VNGASESQSGGKITETQGAGSSGTAFTLFAGEWVGLNSQTDMPSWSEKEALGEGLVASQRRFLLLFFGSNGSESSQWRAS